MDNQMRGGDREPLMDNDDKSQKPSDKWPKYTNSNFSERHLTPKTKEVRTTTWLLTSANIIKMYVGIAFIAVPHAIAQAGLIGAAIGFVYILIMNIFCVYILLKARNRFKREKIVDICDLAVALYGSWIRPLMAILLVCTNACFLMAYVMFLGTQSDQLMCKTWKAAECGKAKLYAIIILLILLPILYLKRLAAVGIFSLIILVFTFLAIFIILYLSIDILGDDVDEANDRYGLHLTEDDRDYKYFDGMMLPIFCAAMMSLFEGNQQILNLYSETDKPQNFFMIALICIVALTFFVAATVGYLGYLAFGNSVKSVILYSLPNEDPLAITAKACYILTIMGSFVIIIQPIFYVIESSNWYTTVSTCGDDSLLDSDNEDDDDFMDEMKKEKEEKKSEKKDEEPADMDVDMAEGAMNEGGAPMSQKSKKTDGTKSVVLNNRKSSFCGYVVYFLFRTLVVAIIVFIAFLIPNLSILITFAGAVLGTIVNILLPVLFYNRAYNNSDKNRKLKKKEDMMMDGDQDETQNMMGRQAQEEEEEDDGSDPRLAIKICSWIVLAFGIVIGIWGLVYVIMELTSGDAKEDTAD